MSDREEDNWNVGKHWWEMDLFDLTNSLAHGSSIKEVAAVLMRCESEVHRKMHELGLEEQK
jgi:hypothetical protein